jgi:hypothetical protein
MDVFRYGTVYTLAISGTSWAGDQTECLVSIDGALLGERIGAAVTNGVLTNPGTLQPPYLSRGEDSVTRSSTLISSIGPSASYGVGSVTISGAQTYSEVIPIDVTTLSTLTTSDRIPVSSTVNSTITFSEVVDDNNNWIWFF